MDAPLNDYAVVASAALSAVVTIVAKALRNRKEPPALPPSSSQEPLREVSMTSLRELIRDEFERALTPVHAASSRHADSVSRIDGHIKRFEDLIREHDAREIESLRLLDALKKDVETNHKGLEQGVRILEGLREDIRRSTTP